MSKIKSNFILLFSFFLFVFSFSKISNSEKNFILIQSTTSTVNSGFYDYILPIFEKKFDIDVKVVSVGTGQAIKNAQRCDGDVLIVHSKQDEEKFVSNGFGIHRHDLMYNDFVLIGPAFDQSNISSSNSIEEALEKIASTNSKFISRGDNSGTHKKERKLWRSIKLTRNLNDYKWYIEVGQGMGTSLNIAVHVNGYVISDRATWLTFKNKKDHQILFEGDKNLFNQYGIILINPDHCNKTKHLLATKFVDWLLSNEGQKIIASFTKNNKQLFFPNARKTNDS